MAYYGVSSGHVTDKARDPKGAVWQYSRLS